MKKFEYKTLVLEAGLSQEDAVNTLNELGDAGWELVSSESFSQNGFTQAVFKAAITSGYLLIFKREKAN